MRKVIAVMLLAACAVLGVGVGAAARYLLSSSAERKGDGEESSSQAKRGERDKAHSESSQIAFLKFGRQFVVPAVSQGQRALMIIDLQIELDPAVAQRAYALEPKLRDSCLSVLLTFGAHGRLPDAMRSTSEAEALKAELLKAVRSILGDGAFSVLITDIAAQPVLD